jgi:hypothetical protein
MFIKQTDQEIERGNKPRVVKMRGDVESWEQKSELGTEERPRAGNRGEM